VKRSLFFATIIASIVPTIVFGSIFHFLGPNNSLALLAMLITFTASLLHVIFIGIPCVFLLQKINSLNWHSILCAGFFIGVIFGLALSFTNNEPCSGCSYKAGTEWLVINGVRTSTDWHDYMIPAIAFGLLGTYVSGVFYSVFRKLKP
jgi:hypothetical protein